MDRCFQSLLMISTVCLSWLLMMFFHELGHAWHGWLSGARLEGIHLPLVGFSRTDFASNPHPLFVAWGGPAWGCLFPILIMSCCYALSCFILAQEEQKGTEEVAGKNLCKMENVIPATSSVPLELNFLPRWFAGFCLVVNGAYLLGGIFLTGGADDGGAILQHGGSWWQLPAFGIPALVAGLYLWNGLGPYFGLGPSRGKVDRKAALGVTMALVVVACVELYLANH